MEEELKKSISELENEVNNKTRELREIVQQVEDVRERMQRVMQGIETGSFGYYDELSAFGHVLSNI